MKELRMKLGLNQTDFWSRVGVTQSAGSRYESGTTGIPKSVTVLANLAYTKKPLSALAKLRGCKVGDLT